MLHKHYRTASVVSPLFFQMDTDFSFWEEKSLAGCVLFDNLIEIHATPWPAKVLNGILAQITQHGP